MSPEQPRSEHGKVNAFVRAHFKHARLAAQYQAKIDALLPFKRRADAAHTDLKIRFQKMTGGQLSEANRIISTTPLAPAQERKARARLYPPQEAKVNG